MFYKTRMSQTPPPHFAVAQLHPALPAGVETFLQLTAHLADGLYILDQQGRIVLFNDMAEKLLGWSRDSVMGKDPHALFHFQNAAGERIPSERCPILQHVQRGEIFRAEEEVFTHRDGHPIPLALTAVPLLDAHRQIIGSFTLFSDLGLKKQWERDIKQARDIAMETSRLKSEFLANMSHEIRTPINGVIGMADLLLDSRLNKDQKELATTLKESAQALLTVISDILDFSSLEAGRMETAATPFSPIKLVEEVAELMASQAQQKSLELLTDISPKLPGVLLGDPARLRQVLLNLIGNALKFTRKGGVVIQARLTDKTKSPLMVRFSVTDTGIGIPKSAWHKLFQPFSQVDGSSTRPFGGMGLGLSISNRLVELMGGEMGMTSRRGKGSTFWFSVPFPLSARIEESQPTPLPTNRLKGIKALVIDPRQTSQTILLNHLLNWSMKGAAVESTDEALAYLRHEARAGAPCDLLLAASPIPLEKCLELGRIISEDATIPPLGMILITGIHEKKWFDEARKVGFMAHLARPLHRHQLLDRLLMLVNPTPQEEMDPHRPESVPPEPRTNKPSFPGEATQPERTILLAEDNAVNQKVAQLQINRLGFGVHTYANGRDAIQAANSGIYAMILMDCHMPILDGLQAARAIRQLEHQENRPRTPIIALTSNALPEDRQRCLDHGMDDILNKPIRIEELANRIDQWLPSQINPDATTPETSQAETLPPMSLERLHGQFGADPKVIGEFIDAYLSSASLIIAKLKKNLKLKDAVALEEYAHELKGASAHMGAHLMSRLCIELQAAARDNDSGACRPLVERIQKEFRRCENYIKKMETI
ncbi:Sensor histidine kinase RcsC [Candidatus Magnetaquicoccaceae bacterium FCR-1]|uniref:histidine kinase n=2 Tax=Candidatus Magnetaquiglobus chichijimensis TaxID=3141448 RepID=A0ABQ0C9F4_9PROT